MMECWDPATERAAPAAEPSPLRWGCAAAAIFLLSLAGWLMVLDAGRRIWTLAS